MTRRILALYKDRRDLRLVAVVLGHTGLRSKMVSKAPLPEDADAALEVTWASAAGGQGEAAGREVPAASHPPSSTCTTPAGCCR